MVILVHHAASRAHPHPPSSLAALRNCLEEGARIVELDVTPLAGGDFALLHDARLEEATNCVGPVCAATATQMRGCRHLQGGVATTEPVGLLSQAISLVSDCPGLQELQLDLKTHASLTEAVLADLIRLIEPAKEQVRVSSLADWALRRLHALMPDLALGFDPMFYLDVRSEDEPEAPPFRLGAYGYWDDHPLACRCWGEAEDYLAARAEALLAQAPAGAVWYIRAQALARVLSDGFDWIAYLHGQGCQVDAWTLNASEPEDVALARWLLAAGVDRITTEEAPLLARLLGDGVRY